MKKEFLEAGKIVTTHGIRGEIKIMPYTDTAELLCEFDRLFMGRSHEEIYIERSRVFKNTVIAKIEGVDTPEAAEKLRNKILYMHRDDLELDEDTYYISDLIGLKSETLIRTKFTAKLTMFCKQAQMMFMLSRVRTGSISSLQLPMLWYRLTLTAES